MIALAIIALLIGLFIFGRSQSSGNLSVIDIQSKSKVSEVSPKISIEDNHKKNLEEEVKSRPWLAHLAPEYQGLGAANWWKAPIAFYGVVVDEKGERLAGARIKIIVSDISKSGTSEYGLKAADSGIFIFEGKKGRGISVYAEKEGYYQTSSSVQHFNYGGEGLSKAFRPDPARPVVFVLYKKSGGVPLLSVEGGVSLPKDGSAVEISLMTGRRAKKGEGDIMVSMRTKVVDGKPNAQFPWEYEIEVPDGGLLETTDEFAFMAPDSGYSQKLSRKYIPGDESWRDIEQVYLYVKNRQAHYAYVDLSIIPRGDHFVHIISRLNPSGSRQLEPSEKSFYEAVYRLDGLREFRLKERNYKYQ